MRMYRNALKYICGVLLGSVILAGCGSKVEEYTDAAMTEISNGQYSQAMSSLDIAEENGEDPMMLARARGIASYYLMDYESAVNYYIESLSYTGSSVHDIDYDLNYYLAQSYERLGAYDKALTTYTAIIDLSPKETMAYYYRGTDYLITGEHDLAIEDFEKALDLAPNNYDLRIEIAGRLSENYYEEEGIKYLQNFLVDNEKKLSSFDKGRIYYYMGDLENAKVFLEDARDDDDYNTVLYLGKTYEKLKDYNYAASVYDNFLKRHPESAVIYNQLGLSKLAQGDYEASLNEWDLARGNYESALNAFLSAKNIENNGIDQVLSFNEIVAYEKLGDFSKAKSLMNAYMNSYPDDEAAKKESVFLSTR